MNIVSDNLDQIINAPDGIKRLRELILQLAVQGKLVPQCPEEGSADELLKQIKEAKRKDAEQRKARGERIRKQKPLPTIGKDEIPYEIPKGWKWVRLGRIADQRLGKMLDKNKNSGKLYPYLRNANVRWYDFDLSDLKELRLEPHEVEDVSVRFGDLVVCEGGEPGRAAIWEDNQPIVIQKALHRIRSCDLVYNWFLLYVIRSDADSGRLEPLFTGATIKHLTGKTLVSHIIPLPPLAEQKRIVAKVDELMAWCDELDALKEKRTALRTAALKASLNQLTTRFAGDTETPSSNRSVPPCLCGEKIMPLITSPADVKQLRDAILQLAVQGRLVEQRDSDGTAADLLQQIEAAKAADLERRKANGERIRKTKPLPPIGNEEIPFLIPDNWKWVRLGNVTRYGESKKVSPNEIPDDRWVLELEDIEKNSSRILARHTFGQRKSKSSKATFKQGDVLYGKLRPYLNKAVVADADGVCTTEIVAIEQYAGIEPYFMLNILKSPYFIGHVNELTYGIKMPRLGTTDAKNTAIPLPPLAEQRRIVTKVDELMAWCDELERLLQTESETAARFAAAVAKA